MTARQNNEIENNVYLQVPNRGEQWEEIIHDFETLWQFFNACGAMDGKHVNIRCPAKTGSQFFNYKKTFSTILFAVVDARYNFLYIDVGTNGRANDASVFAKSAFKRALEEDTLNVPPCGVFIGDDAFPLRPNLLKPYSRCGHLNTRQKIFNYRLSRARRVVENAFGILVSRFRVFEKPISLSLRTAEQMVKTACALHNWLRKNASHGTSARQMPSYSLDLRDRQTGRREMPEEALSAFGRLPKTSMTNHPRAATQVRDQYAESFMTTRSVPWQWKMI